MSNKIFKLPDVVANQIAAGEVVERPVAVVKELIENALDAGAKSVEIQFERGGKALIRILDDGEGMSREDALMALQRHATSKIRNVEDILRISSFGFRGEALPSIASVSKFSLRTRTAESSGGTEIRVNVDQKPIVADCGMPTGTEICVANLFHNVPARRKFLKTDRTESAHIIQVCRLLAVAHPEVAFSLVEDGHEIFRTPACPDRMQRVREIFGKRRTEDLMPVDYERDGFRLNGLVGRPGTGRSTRSEMVTYVNLRPVDSRLLNYALIESYHRFLPRGRYPVAFLFVAVPPEEVDVNVHPTKREVRFRNEPLVRSTVMIGLTELLTAQSRKALQRAETVEPLAPPAEAEGAEPAAPPRPAVFPKTPVARSPFPTIPEKPYANPSVVPSTGVFPGKGQDKPIWRFCGIFRNQFGLFEGPDGLILLNARAARERILFERIEASLAGEKIPRQPLLIPPMMELSPLDAGILEDQIGFLDGMGFGIEPFGRHLFRIRSVPVWLQSDSPEAFVEDIVNRIRERGIRTESTGTARSLVARLAAIREARGFNPASQGEWEATARHLLACENPLLDGRGKPSFIELRHAEISRRLMLEGTAEELEGLDRGH